MTATFGDFVARYTDLMGQEDPDWSALSADLDAACRASAEKEAARTGRTVAEVEADALDQVQRYFREWMNEPVAEVSRD